MPIPAIIIMLRASRGLKRTQASAIFTNEIVTPLIEAKMKEGRAIYDYNNTPTSRTQVKSVIIGVKIKYRPQMQSTNPSILKSKVLYPSDFSCLWKY